MFEVSIPALNGEDHQLRLEDGKTVFILGPNGSGKSSLLQYIAKQAPNLDVVKWVRAHRRSWIESNFLDITPSQFKDLKEYHTGYLRRTDARYSTQDDGFDSKSSIAFLIQRHNADARKVKSLLRGGQDQEARSLAHEGDILHTLNSALRKSNIPIVVSIGDEENVVATKNGSTYGVNEMSDGERSVILLAADVLTADGGTLFLLDEPERHLHRAIISPLLSTLFASRADCGFVISTHDTALPKDNPKADLILTRSCSFHNDVPARWALDVISARQHVPEDIRAFILGARTKIVFIEGIETSLDYLLYSRVFPEVSVVPVGASVNVVNAVRTTRLLENFHGVVAFGLVDRDYRDANEVDELKRDGIFVVDGYAVESIYYDMQIQRMVAERTLGKEDAARRLRSVEEAALKIFESAADRLCRSKAEAKRRRIALAKIDQMDLDEEILELNGKEIVEGEKVKFDEYVQKRDLDSLIREYAIKKSGVLDRIARELGLFPRSVCESAVRQLLNENDAALRYVRRRFKGLLDAMGED